MALLWALRGHVGTCAYTHVEGADMYPYVPSLESGQVGIFQLLSRGFRRLFSRPVYFLFSWW